MRGVAAIVGGLIVGLIALAIVGFVGGMIFPPEPGTRIRAGADFGEIFGALPQGAKMAAILSWAIGAFAGSAVAKLIARRNWAAWVIGLLFLLLAAANLSILPMPGWMKVLGLAGPIVGALLASLIPARERAVSYEDEEFEEEEEPFDAGVARP